MSCLSSGALPPTKNPGSVPEGMSMNSFTDLAPPPPPTHPASTKVSASWCIAAPTSSSRPLFLRKHDSESTSL